MPVLTVTVVCVDTQREALRSEQKIALMMVTQVVSKGLSTDRATISRDRAKASTQNTGKLLFCLVLRGSSKCRRKPRTPDSRGNLNCFYHNLGSLP